MKLGCFGEIIAPPVETPRNPHSAINRAVKMTGNGSVLTLNREPRSVSDASPPLFYISRSPSRYRAERNVLKNASDVWMFHRMALVAIRDPLFYYLRDLFFISFREREVADKIISVPFFLLKMLSRYRTRRLVRYASRASSSLYQSSVTDTTLSFVSPPKQPALPRTAPPTVPGRPPAHSTPASECAIANFNRSAIGTPAPTVTAVPFTFISLIATRNTRPLKPLSLINRFVPPPSTNTGNSVFLPL